MTFPEPKYMDNTAKTTGHKRRKSILEMDSNEVSRYLLKSESYCSLELPNYIVFDTIIEDVKQEITRKDLSELGNIRKSLRGLEDVNYVILDNKDGKYAWRPFELIHPALYVSLTNQIAEQWSDIVKRFKDFSSNERLTCLSLPGESITNQSDKAEQISHWWEEVEQRSLEYALDYEYLIQTDITDCYGAIYTHSIAWALHGKEKAKSDRSNKNLIGNIIDSAIQDMRYGQTNGIPQGSSMMDFIAEMVLGYADGRLSERLEEARINNYYQILRYRDDYRLFVNSPQVGASIVKLITETISELGLKLNASKTHESSDVVRASIKSDKLEWIGRKQWDNDPQKHLLTIYNHAIEFPNSGSVRKAMDKFNRRLTLTRKPVNNPVALIAIVANIAYRNPRTYHVCAAVIANLLLRLEDEAEMLQTIQRIKRKFEQIPNTGLMQIWLQRITFSLDRFIKYPEPICQLVEGSTQILWNNNWLAENPSLQKAIDARKIIDEDILDSIEPSISLEEVELFSNNASYW